jgi:hypothetical protein
VKAYFVLGAEHTWTLQEKPPRIKLPKTQLSKLISNVQDGISTVGRLGTGKEAKLKYIIYEVRHILINPTLFFHPSNLFVSPFFLFFSFFFFLNFVVLQARDYPNARFRLAESGAASDLDVVWRARRIRCYHF